MNEEPGKGKYPAAKWVKRFGVAGFLFFLIKGLLWLIIPAALVYFGVSGSN